MSDRVWYWTSPTVKRGFGVEWGGGQILVHFRRRIFLWSVR